MPIPGPAHGPYRPAIAIAMGTSKRAAAEAARRALDLTKGAGHPGGGFDPNWMWKSCKTKGLNPKRRKAEKLAKRRNRKRCK